MEKQPVVSLSAQLGPWAGYLNAYTTLIKERGYSPGSVQTQVQLITRFSEWLRRGHTEVHALDEIIVERYLRRHHSARFGRPRAADASSRRRTPTSVPRPLVQQSLESGQCQRAANSQTKDRHCTS